MAVHLSRGASSIFLPVFLTSILIACAGAHAARGIEPDIPKIQAGAERGSIAEEIELGAAYLAGRGVERDFKQAAYWYGKAANSGDPVAQLEVGLFYEAGIGVDRNPARAAQWFERAAGSGLPTAKVNLGIAFVSGLGVPKDPDLGARLFREAAKKGEGAGACYLGNLYYFGLGVPHDPAEAKHWFEIGAKLHNPMAKFNLAIMLFNAHDRAQDREALKLLRQASNDGYVLAKHQLGVMMVLNPALERTPGDAAAFLEQAAAEGSWRSSVVLGLLARDGRSGVAKDKRTSYYHFKVAALQGGNDAAQLLSADLRGLEAQLGSSETSLIDSEASAWVSKHHNALQFANYIGVPALGLEYPDVNSSAAMLINSPLSGVTQQPLRPVDMTLGELKAGNK